MLNHSKHTNNSILWNQIIQGDEKAFHRLFEEQYRSLMKFGLGIRMDKELVKDMIQEVFLEIWKKHSNLPPVENLDAYLKQILKRKIFKSIKKEKKISISEIPLEDEYVNSYESFLIEKETNLQVQSKLSKAFQTLTPKQKEIMELRFVKGLSYDDIASKTATQKRTIYNQVHSAILILKKYML